MIAEPPEWAAAIPPDKWMGYVAEIPCVICGRLPVNVHHCIFDRFSQHRASDYQTIPLCPACHDELHDDKTAWRELYGGPDYRFLPMIFKRVKEMI